MDNQTIVKELREFGIETERELDAAAGTLVPLPFGNMKGESEND